MLMCVYVCVLIVVCIEIVDNGGIIVSAQGVMIDVAYVTVGCIDVVIIIQVLLV